MTHDPEFTAELDRRYEEWLGGLNPSTMPRKAQQALERGDMAGFERALFAAFLAEELEEAMAANPDFVSTVELKSDGTMTRLWYKRQCES